MYRVRTGDYSHVTYKTVVCQNYTVHLYASVENQGDFSESVQLTFYLNGSAFHTSYPFQAVSGSISSYYFLWNTTGYPRYTTDHITVSVTLLNANETDLTDNSIDYQIKISYPGDVNADKVVDTKDLALISIALYSRPGDAKWNANCDITNDYYVDMRDMAIAARYFGHDER
jgi:hypothetical protein